MPWFMICSIFISFFREMVGRKHYEITSWVLLKNMWARIHGNAAALYRTVCGRIEKEYDVRRDGYQACAQNGIRTYMVGLQRGYGVGV